MQKVADTTSQKESIRFKRGVTLTGIQSRSGYAEDYLSDIYSTQTANLRIANTDLEHQGVVSGMKREAPVVNANFEKMAAIMANMSRVLKTENKLEMIVNLLEEISKQYGMKKATFYALSENYDRVFRKCTPKERNKFIHTVPYADEKDGMSY